ncbi:Nup84p SCDLUD_002716 [Saccharomycodes ludwigii]|uniref:Nup84p n=1 Tax=Saccharomycodes ludwigii TaxID=36035 RepID=UPI001E81ECC4|nr:hypothetical protein SCDLUD_002716 [Saccharomycodes ludwigii]KAH3901230.1 hypothetical protein SCDLUD_002716 [Saccharomycodes ludwigii]
MSFSTINTNDNNKQSLIDFAQSLKDYEINSLNAKQKQQGPENEEHHGVDIFDTLLCEFRSLSGTQALSTCNNRIVCENWTLETKLWHLVELLFSFRSTCCSDDYLKEDLSVYDYNSDLVFKKELLNNNKELYEIWLIMCWVQQNLKKVEKPDNLPTSKWINSVINGNFSSCDTDYPLRNPTKELDPEDRKRDSIFHKYIYQLLLSGNYDQAREECELCDNLTLSMIMCGLEEYFDPSIDTQITLSNNETAIVDNNDGPSGCARKALWRRTVYALSKNPKIDKYEANIYRFLAGDATHIDADLEVHDWDVHLLLYLNELWNSSIENYLLSNGRIAANDLILIAPSNELSVQQILDTISTKCYTESSHPIRILMGSVIMNNVQSIAKNFVVKLLEAVGKPHHYEEQNAAGDEQTDYIFKESYLLRILTHLYIITKVVFPSAVDEQSFSKLISAYVSILSMYELYEYIPIYVKFLDEDSLLETYSYFLTSIYSDVLKNEQIQLSTALNIPMNNVIRITAQKVFDETASHYQSGKDVAISTVVTDVDKKIINSVLWLEKAQLSVDVLEAIIAASRRFLLNGRVESVAVLFDSIDINSNINNYNLSKLPMLQGDEKDAKVKEILNYKLLVNALKKRKTWQKQSLNLNAQSNLPTLIKQFQDFSQTFYKLTHSFLTGLQNINDAGIIFDIRAFYVPFLVIELHKELMSASKALNIDRFAHEALSLATLVANEHYKMYTLFLASGKLKEFLDLVAKSSITIGKMI